MAVVVLYDGGDAVQIQVNDDHYTFYTFGSGDGNYRALDCNGYRVWEEEVK